MNSFDFRAGADRFSQTRKIGKGRLLNPKWASRRALQRRVPTSNERSQTSLNARQAHMRPGARRAECLLVQPALPGQRAQSAETCCSLQVGALLCCHGARGQLVHCAARRACVRESVPACRRALGCFVCSWAFCFLFACFCLFVCLLAWLFVYACACASACACACACAHASAKARTRAGTPPSPNAGTRFYVSKHARPRPCTPTSARTRTAHAHSLAHEHAPACLPACRPAGLPACRPACRPAGLPACLLRPPARPPARQPARPPAARARRLCH